METSSEIADPSNEEPKNGAEAPKAEAPKAAAAKSDGEGASAASGAAPAKAADRGARAVMSAQIDELMATVRRLEHFASDEAKRVSGKLVPEVESRAKQNIWVTILLALGLGLILGIWLTGGRRRD